MKKPATMRERARALAQECVLFGNLKGAQWDGLTALLMTFAESEIKLAAPPASPACLCPSGSRDPICPQHGDQPVIVVTPGEPA